MIQNELRIGNLINFTGDIIVVTMIGQFGIQSKSDVEIINAEKDVANHSEDFKELKQITSSINSKLNGLLIYLQAKDSKLKGLIQSQSPIQLTDFGFKVYKEYGGEEFVEQNKDGLLKEIGKKNPKTSLDVQNSAIDIITEKNSDKSFNEIKEYIYNHPSVDKEGSPVDIDISALNFVIGIILRNEYIKANPHIEEVD